MNNFDMNNPRRVEIPFKINESANQNYFGIFTCDLFQEIIETERF